MPHEVDMTRALIQSLEEWWVTQPAAQPVGRVVLQVGEFTCVEPDLLRRSFTQQKQRTDFLRSADLQIENIPFVAYCEQCLSNYYPDIGLEYRCPQCDSGLHNIISGRELKIAQVNWVNNNEKGVTYVQSKRPSLSSPS